MGVRAVGALLVCSLASFGLGWLVSRLAAVGSYVVATVPAGHAVRATSPPSPSPPQHCIEPWADDLRRSVHSADDLRSIGPFDVAHGAALRELLDTEQAAALPTLVPSRELRGVSFIVSTYPGTSHALMDVSNLYVALQAGVSIDRVIFTHPWTSDSAGVGSWTVFVRPLLAAMLSALSNPPAVLGVDSVSGEFRLETAVHMNYRTQKREPWFCSLPALCFRDTVRAGLGLPRALDAPGAALLYVKRTHARTIANEETVEQQLLDFAAARGMAFSAHYTGAGAPTAGGGAAPVALTLRQQVEMAGAAGILVGMHGAGVALCAFAPRGAVFVELQPPGKRWDFYRQLCEQTAGVHVETLRLPASACEAWGAPPMLRSEGSCDAANVDLGTLQAALHGAAVAIENHRLGVESEVN